MQQNHSRALLVVASLSMMAGSAIPPVLANTWAALTEEGSEAFQQSNYGQAERAFRAALKEAETFGDHDLRLATSLTNLGVVYKAHAQEAKAEPLFERAVAVQQNALGPDNFEVLTSVARLCQFYMQRAEWPKADGLCSKIVLWTQTHKTSSEHELDLATLLDGLAKSFDGHPQSEPLFRMALALREKRLQPQHMAIAASCDSLAKVLAAHGRHADAEPLFHRAFEISSTLGKTRPEALIYTESYAQCCANLGRGHEAEQIYRAALENCKDAYGPRSGYTAKMQIGLANLLMKQGRYGEASTLLSEALRTQETIQGPQNATLSPILDAYADTLDKTNRHSEAAKLHNRAKAIRGWM